MTDDAAFCVGCNERSPTGSKLCPRCGAMAVLGEGDTTPRRRLAPDDGTQTGSASADDSELIGRELADYRIEAFLGRGGMARVYKARHVTLHRPCALKILDRRLAEGDEIFVERFFAEARAAAALVHPNIVTVHNIGEEGGLHFIEMEYVAGTSLQNQVRQRGHLDPLRATEWMVEMAAGLAGAHDGGIVHRDLKPANVLVDATDHAKLADFGLAKPLLGAEPDTILAGTPHYMAPELFECAPAATTADVYAAGVSYYYLLSGRMPFVAPSLMQLAQMHTRAEPPDIQSLEPDVPSRAAEVLRRCLAKDPAQRYPDGRALYQDLRAVFGTLRPLAALVDEAISGQGWSAEGHGEAFVITVPLAAGRSQKVRVESVGIQERAADELVRIESDCAPFEPGYAARALRLNAHIPHAAIAVHDREGRPCLVMCAAYPRATCDPEEVRVATATIAEWADHVERTLTGDDVH